MTCAPAVDKDVSIPSEGPYYLVRPDMGGGQRFVPHQLLVQAMRELAYWSGEITVGNTEIVVDNISVCYLVARPLTGDFLLLTLATWTRRRGAELHPDIPSWMVQSLEFAPAPETE